MCSSQAGNNDKPVAQEFPTFHDVLETDEEWKNLSETDLIKAAERKAERSRVLLRRSPKPKFITDHVVADEDELASPKEMAALTGMPQIHQERTVVIRNRTSTSFQSGGAYEHQWQISWKHSENWTNPITGYISGADPLTCVNLKFDTKEEAIEYAERYGWKYEITAPVSHTIREPGWREYGHNFLPQSVRNVLDEEGPKTQYFKNSNYGASHFSMPLKYHGDGEVTQHGGE